MRQQWRVTMRHRVIGEKSIVEKWPIGVFASIDAGMGVHLEVARELGVKTVQLHAPRPESRGAAAARDFARVLRGHDLRATCVFGGFDDESYADIPAVKRTVGLVPPTSRQQRLRELREISDFARVLDVDAIGLHVGFVPHDSRDPLFADIVGVTRTLCDYCAGNGQNLHLETGQEPGEILLRFLNEVGTRNLFINFDPANMILYGVGEPLPALKELGPFVRSVHCKDAKRSDLPGITWGQEVPLGEGDVDIAGYLKALDRIGYEGPLTIEREIPQEPRRQQAEIGRAIELLTRLKAPYLG
jgi:sugar phosphate isomerase/epimerase